MSKQKFKDRFLLAVLGYLAIGLVALFSLARFWLPSGYTLGGHDSGLPLDAKLFLETRTFAWDDRIGFGSDNAHLFGSLTLHFVDYLSSLVSGVPYSGNWFNLFFWLGAIFLAGSLFAYHLRDILGRYFVFIFPPLVIFNFYLFQSIFMLERAKYSILVGTLLFLTIVLKFQARQLSMSSAAALSVLALFIFNVGGLLGLPLYGSLLVIILGLLVFACIAAITRKKFRELFRFVSFLFLTTVGFLLLNTYQILPYLPSILNKSFGVHLGSTVITSNRGWVDYISQSTSFLNIFRLQGIPTWYQDAYVINTGHPYAGEYLSNIVLIIVSFLLPVIAFGSLLLARTPAQRKIVLLFALIALLSIPFTAGTAPPAGKFYGFLYEHFPGFFIFRTPYYKFGGAYFLSIVFLISASTAFGITAIVKFLTRKIPVVDGNLLGYGLSLFVVVSWFAFHYNLLIPEKVLSWERDASTKFVLPTYVNEARDKLNQLTPHQGRVLLLPPIDNASSADGYNWGYWSLAPLPYVLTSASTLSNDVSLFGEERAWVQLLYESIEREDEQRITSLAKRLGVRFLLLREDSISSSTKHYSDILNNVEAVKKVDSFDQWSLYEINSQTSKFTTASSAVLISSAEPYLAREWAWEMDYSIGQKTISDPGLFEDIYAKKAQVVDCMSCLLDNKPALGSLPHASILPNSIFYPLKTWRENKTLTNARANNEKLAAYLGFSLRRAGEIKTMLDLGTNERVIVKSLEVINSYFDKLYEVLTGAPDDFLANFLLLKLTLDYLQPIENEFRGYSSSRDFDSKGSPLREEVLGVLWRIDKITAFFSPILDKPEKWQLEKIYNLNFPESGTSSLNLHLPSIPQYPDGKPIFPTSLELTRSDVKEELRVSGVSNRWIKVDLGRQEKGEARLTLNFDNLPNLYRAKSAGVEEFPSGKRGCFTGDIANFRSDRKYRVRVKTLDRQDVRLIFRDPSRVYSKRHNFVSGEQTVDVPTNFDFLYYPSPSKTLDILVCGRDDTLPNIDQVFVQEVFAPLIINVLEKEESTNLPPAVRFERSNPVKYSLRVSGATGPFLLVFNERYSPLWNLEKQDARNKSLAAAFPELLQIILAKTNTQENQVIVDGYANGWLIDGRGDFDLTLDYVPQKLFLIGSSITLLSILVSMMVVVNFFIRKRITRKRIVRKRN